MKKNIAIILTATMVLGMSVSLSGCGGSSDTKTAATEAPAATEAAVETEAPAAEATAEPVATAVAEPGVDRAVAYGDYTSMQKLAADITNMYINNKVVSVDGDYDTAGGAFFICESNAEGKVAKTKIEVEGWAEADYPAAGTHVKIKGTVTVKNMKTAIIIQPEDFEIVE